MQDARFRCTDALKAFFDDDAPLYSDTIQLVKWPSGIGMPPHADNSNPNGSPHPTPFRKYASVIYLNDDFEGGNLLFPSLRIEIKPKRGLMVGLLGDRKHEHGVRTVTKGNRYTMPGWYTDDLTYRDPHSLESY